jgi:hypothetical protein
MVNSCAIVHRSNTGTNSRGNTLFKQFFAACAWILRVITDRELKYWAVKVQRTAPQSDTQWFYFECGFMLELYRFPGSTVVRPIRASDIEQVQERDLHLLAQWLADAGYTLKDVPPPQRRVPGELQLLRRRTFTMKFPSNRNSFFCTEPLLQINPDD